MIIVLIIQGTNRHIINLRYNYPVNNIQVVISIQNPKNTGSVIDYVEGLLQKNDTVEIFSFENGRVRRELTKLELKMRTPSQEELPAIFCLDLSPAFHLIFTARLKSN